MFSRLRADSSYLNGRTPTIAIIPTLRLVSTFESAKCPQTHELFWFSAPFAQAIRMFQPYKPAPLRHSAQRQSQRTPRSGAIRDLASNGKALQSAPPWEGCQRRCSHNSIYTILPTLSTGNPEFFPVRSKIGRNGINRIFCLISPAAPSDNKPAS